MKGTKVHILRWSKSNGSIGGVYADYNKACRIAYKKNKKRNFIHRFLDNRWVVQTFDVK